MTKVWYNVYRIEKEQKGTANRQGNIERRIMSKREATLIKEYVERACSITNAINRIEDTWPAWRKEIAWKEIDNWKAALQKDLKELTGLYIPIG